MLCLARCGWNFRMKTIIALMLTVVLAAPASAQFSLGWNTRNGTPKGTALGTTRRAARAAWPPTYIRRNTTG